MGGRWRLRRRLMLLPVALLLAAGAAIGAQVGLQQATGNFHVVIPGVLYRSAQPSPERLEAYQRSYGIRTIVNLRGRNAAVGWYDAEARTAARLGVTLVDFPLSAASELTAAQLEQLLGILTAARKPLLIHCEAGADRTGLASAIFLAAVARQGEAAAERQLSLRFGHFSIPYTATYAMDRSFERFEERFGFAGS